MRRELLIIPTWDVEMETQSEPGIQPEIQAGPSQNESITPLRRIDVDLNPLSPHLESIHLDIPFLNADTSALRALIQAN